MVPRTLAENAGMDAANTIAAMYAAHKGGQGGVGIDISEMKATPGSAPNYTASGRCHARSCNEPGESPPAHLSAGLIPASIPAERPPLFV